MFSQEVPHPSVRQKAEPRLPNAAANAKTLKIARPKTSIQYREFSRETGRNFYPRLSFKQILISKEHPSSLKLKLTIAKKYHVLFEKIFFEFRIMIYRTIPCLILPRWHRVASLTMHERDANERIFIRLQPRRGKLSQITGLNGRATNNWPRGKRYIN